MPAPGTRDLQMVGNAVDKALMWYPENDDAGVHGIKIVLKQYVEYCIQQSFGDSLFEDVPRQLPGSAFFAPGSTTRC
jgi:hypothetical protein